MFSIAPVSLRTGAAESKPFAALAESSARKPTYELRGNSLRVRFAALQSALIDEPKAPNGQRDSDHVPKSVPKDVPKLTEKEAKILELIADDRMITTYRMAVILDTSRKTVQRTLDKLKAAGLITRVGSSRNGYWEIQQETDR